MVMNLLPASAAAFAPRASPTVVLNSRPEPWLTATLKRVNRVKRPLNNVTQHTRCLTELLSSEKAIWTLCSIIVPKTPESEEPKANSGIHPMFNYQMLHIEAYVVHVDMVSQHEVAFKLTPDTIESLVDYHKEVFSVDTAASTWDWPEKEIQLKQLQEEFVQAANKFVFRTNAHALEGMEEEGAGELLCGRSEDAKAAVLGLFVPLLPPPPRIVDVIRPVPLLPSSTGPEDEWWNSGTMQHTPTPTVPNDSWQTHSSSPSTTTTSTTSADTNPNTWASISMSEVQLPSPVLSHIQPLSNEPYTTTEFYSSPTTIPAIPNFLVPSMLVQQQCSAAAGLAGLGWGDRYQDLALPYGTTM
ncbi:hypothetical protein VTO42DRAFT_50 [Malbranchea cinnamomea]